MSNLNMKSKPLLFTEIFCGSDVCVGGGSNLLKHSCIWTQCPVSDPIFKLCQAHILVEFSSPMICTTRKIATIYIVSCVSTNHQVNGDVSLDTQRFMLELCNPKSDYGGTGSKHRTLIKNVLISIVKNSMCEPLLAPFKNVDSTIRATETAWRAMFAHVGFSAKHVTSSRPFRARLRRSSGTRVQGSRRSCFRGFARISVIQWSTSVDKSSCCQNPEVICR